MAAPVLPAQRPIAGRDVLIACGVAALVMAFGLSLVPTLFQENPGGHRRQLVTIAAFAVNAAAFGGAVWALLARNQGYAWRDFGVRPVDAKWLRRAFYYGLGMVPVAFLVAAAVRHVTGISPSQGIAIAPPGMSWVAAGTIVLYGGFLVPVFEEIFFRGILFGWLRQKVSLPAAIILSAGLFAVFHFRLDIIVPAFLMGLLLAWVYVRSGSVLPSIMIHAAFNTAQFALVYGLVAFGPAGQGSRGAFG